MGGLRYGLSTSSFRGVLGTAFHFDRFAGVFWLEMLVDLGGGWLLQQVAEHA